MKTKGSVYTYGLGKSGELGNRIRSDREIIPFKVENIPRCKSVSAGCSFSLILSESGDIWASGKSKNGRSGSKDSVAFTKILNLPKIVNISAGYWHSLALDDQNQIWSTGYNSYGQLGLGTSENQLSFAPTRTQAIKISAGGHYSLAISPDGQLLSCGTDRNSGIGRPALVFSPVAGLSSVQFIDAGQIHAGCIADGKLYTWGNNTWGQLGHSQLKHTKKPKIVPQLQDIMIIAVSCSKGEKYASTGCIDADHRVFMWGCGYKGKLGLDAHWSHEDPADRLDPEVIPGFMSDSIELGGIHTSSVSQGVLFTWGCGSDGRIGHPEVQGHRYLYKEPQPRPIQGISGVVQISSSYYHNIFLAD